MKPAPVREGRLVDHVVAMAGPQKPNEVQTALRARGREPGKMVVTNLGANAVHRFVPRPGVVHRNPRRRLQSGPQNLPRLADEPLLTRGQEPHHLAFGDRHPEVVKQTNQTLHGGLAPVILGQHETAKLGPEVPGDAWWRGATTVDPSGVTQRSRR